MAHSIKIDIREGQAEVHVERGETYLAGGQWGIETGELDISWYAENGENVVNPETGESTNTEVIKNVWTLSDLLREVERVLS